MLKITEGNLRKSLKSTFKRMNAPYKLVIVNEETLLEAMTIHLTKKSVFILISSLFVGLFLLFSAIIFFTPLKYYIPGNNNNSISRAKLIQIQRTADSLAKLNAQQEQFIVNLLHVANGSLKQSLDTTLLPEKEINAAFYQNNSQIDRASRYDYLKNQKPDTNVDKSLYKKDSLKDAK